MLVSLPYWVYRIVRHGKYWGALKERFGHVPDRLHAINGPVVWVHAVSVGEVLAVAGLVEELKRTMPTHRVMVSTTTETGQELARKKFGEENVLYFPLDFGFAIRPYLRALKPEMVVLAETEFWPNFLHEVQANGARIAVVNARISDRSWPNYKRFRWALRRMLAHVDLFLAQTDEDAARLKSIGVEADRVRVSGNLKFDVKLPVEPAIVGSLRKALAAGNAGPVLVCGSTVEGEEELLLKAFADVRAKNPLAVMILAPRHPQRFDEAAELLRRLQVDFHRRSQWAGEGLASGVLLVDSIGELAALYALADVAFVGGSLVARGGHNIIEPALHGVAIVVGPHTENFRDIVGLFRKREAVRVASAEDLASLLPALLANDSERRALGRRAQQTIEMQVGATARTLSALQALVGDKQPVAAHTE